MSTEVPTLLAKDKWVPHYTQYYATQRNEGHHVAVKQFLNPRITLEQATSHLAVSQYLSLSIPLLSFISLAYCVDIY